MESLKKTLNSASTMVPKLEPEKQHPLTLRIIPPEIRKLVFECTFQLDWISAERYPPKHDCTPTLLVALRPDKELYDEALDVYYTIDKWYLDSRNFNAFAALSTSVLNRIKCICIEMCPESADNRRATAFRAFTRDYWPRIARLTNLEDLHLYSIPEYHVQQGESLLIPLAKNCIPAWKKLKRVSFYTELDSAPMANFQVNLVIEGLLGRKRTMASDVGKGLVCWFWGGLKGESVLRLEERPGGG